MQQNEQPDSLEKTTKSEDENLVNLNTPGVCASLSSRIKDEIDEHTAAIYDDGFRWHLGASKIGDECKRALWYGFRWVYPTRKSGRMQRLFNRGHLEEKRHSEWLKGLGFNVWTHDESQTKPDGAHPQLRIKNKCGGHLGGSLDGIVQFPERYKINGYAILESKTSGTGAGFNSLESKGMAKAKPAHYIQNSIYGADYKIEHVLYICANKNDDDLYIEVAKLDFKLAKDMEAKAHSIIYSQDAPPKISENPTFFQCKSMCDFKDICHANKPAVKNCRSCSNCQAVDNAEFYCSKWDSVIPRAEVPNGCPEWIDITTVGKVIKIVSSGFEIESGLELG